MQEEGGRACLCAFHLIYTAFFLGAGDCRGELRHSDSDLFFFLFAVRLPKFIMYASLLERD